MPAQGYVILRDANGPTIPCYLRSLTGPYLFRSEAEQSAAVIKAATRGSCCLNIITIERMLGEPIRCTGGWLVTNVWDIKPVSTGFEGEVVIAGTLYKVERTNANDPWHVLEGTATAQNQEQ